MRFLRNPLICIASWFNHNLSIRFQQELREREALSDRLKLVEVGFIAACDIVKDAIDVLEAEEYPQKNSDALAHLRGVIDIPDNRIQEVSKLRSELRSYNHLHILFGDKEGTPSTLRSHIIHIQDRHTMDTLELGKLRERVKVLSSVQINT